MSDLNTHYHAKNASNSQKKQNTRREFGKKQ